MIFIHLFITQSIQKTKYGIYASINPYKTELQNINL